MSGFCDVMTVNSWSRSRGAVFGVVYRVVFEDPDYCSELFFIFEHNIQVLVIDTRIITCPVHFLEMEY